MTDSAGLERGYRRLLACYPQPFRREQGEEMLAVLMAGARRGQRRPGLAEAADVIKSVLRMRLGPVRSGPGNREWTDALAVFSVAAPLFLLAADILEVALPYRPPGTALVVRMFGSNYQIGGPSLLSLHFFDIAVAGQVIVAALVLLGLRRVALIAMAASVLYLIVARHWIDWIPYPLQVLTTSVYMLEAVALTASSGPRRGRHLMTWRHGAVLLLAAAAVQASTLMYDATSPPVWPSSPATPVYLVISVVLAVAAATLTVALKMNRYFLVLLAAMFYPYALQLGFPADNSNLPHMTLLYLPPLLLACVAILTAVTPRRSRVLTSPGPEKPGLT